MKKRNSLLSLFVFTCLFSFFAPAEEGGWDGYCRRVGNQCEGLWEGTKNGVCELGYMAHDVACGSYSLALNVGSLGRCGYDWESYSQICQNYDQKYYEGGQNSWGDLYSNSCIEGGKFAASPVIFPYQMGCAVVSDCQDTEGTNTAECWGSAAPQIIVTHLATGGPIYRKCAPSGASTCVPFRQPRCYTPEEIALAHARYQGIGPGAHNQVLRGQPILRGYDRIITNEQCLADVEAICQGMRPTPTELTVYRQCDLLQLGKPVRYPNLVSTTFERGGRFSCNDPLALDNFPITVPKGTRCLTGDTPTFKMNECILPPGTELIPECNGFRACSPPVRGSSNHKGTWPGCQNDE